eukprot:9378663-Pyramimonas_sp.AAC.1
MKPDGWMLVAHRCNHAASEQRNATLHVIVRYVVACTSVPVDKYASDQSAVGGGGGGGGAGGESNEDSWCSR